MTQAIILFKIAILLFRLLQTVMKLILPVDLLKVTPMPVMEHKAIRARIILSSIIILPEEAITAVLTGADPERFIIQIIHLTIILSPAVIIWPCTFITAAEIK